MALTSPVTGAAQTGFTSPTFPLTADKFIGNNGVQYAVDGALGGTQTGATSQTASSPFTISIERPAVLKTQAVNANGVTISQGRNRHIIRVRKGMPAVSGQPPLVGIAEAVISVPVGSESVSPAEIRAMLSCFIGVLTQYSAALGNQVVTGTVTA